MKMQCTVHNVFQFQTENMQGEAVEHFSDDIFKLLNRQSQKERNELWKFAFNKYAHKDFEFVS